MAQQNQNPSQSDRNANGNIGTAGNHDKNVKTGSARMDDKSKDLKNASGKAKDFDLDDDEDEDADQNVGSGKPSKH